MNLCFCGVHWCISNVFNVLLTNVIIIDWHLKCSIWLLLVAVVQLYCMQSNFTQRFFIWIYVHMFIHWLYEQVLIWTYVHLKNIWIYAHVFICHVLLKRIHEWLFIWVFMWIHEQTFICINGCIQFNCVTICCQTHIFTTENNSQVLRRLFMCAPIVYKTYVYVHGNKQTQKRDKMHMS